MNQMLIDLMGNIQGTFNRTILIKTLTAYRGLVILHTNPNTMIDFKAGTYPKEIKLTMGGRRSMETGFERQRIIADTFLEILTSTRGRQVNIDIIGDHLQFNFVNTGVLRRFPVKKLCLNSRESALILGDN